MLTIFSAIMLRSTLYEYTMVVPELIALKRKFMPVMLFDELANILIDFLFVAHTGFFLFLLIVSITATATTTTSVAAATADVLKARTNVTRPIGGTFYCCAAILFYTYNCSRNVIAMQKTCVFYVFRHSISHNVIYFLPERIHFHHGPRRIRRVKPGTQHLVRRGALKYEHGLVPVILSGEPFSGVFGKGVGHRFFFRIGKRNQIAPLDIAVCVQLRHERTDNAKRRIGIGRINI